MAASVPALVLACLASLTSLGACHGTASEPTPAASSASGSPSAASSEPATSTPAPTGPETHAVVFADHRHVVQLRVDDRFVIPSDPEIDWRAEVHGKSGGGRGTGVDAGGEGYR